MPKLILQFEDRVLKEYVVGQRVTIGRLPDNTVVIDNPAVSGHHASIVREDSDFVLEDLRSRNGTYVNDKHVIRHTLQNQDVLLIGKHKLVFDRMADGEAAATEDAKLAVPNIVGTMYLNTVKHRDLLARLRAERKQAEAALSTAAAGETAETTAKAGVLRVLAGRTDQPEYTLEARTSFIGRSDTALVRLSGLFRPKVAMAIVRNGDEYVATPLAGRTQVNSHSITGRYILKDGDVLRVSGLLLEFRLKSQGLDS
jgi:hypothetical protein